MTLPIVSPDTETFEVTDTDKAPIMVCTSWAYEGGGSGLVKHDDPGLRDMWADWYEHYLLTGANTAFDAAVVMRRFPELTPLIFDAFDTDRVRDTLAAAKMIDNAEGIMHFHPVRDAKGSNYSLNALAKRLLGRGLDKAIWDEDPNHYGKLYNVPLEDWTERDRLYPVDDAVANIEIDSALLLGWPEFLKPWYYETRSAFWLYLTGAQGICTDPTRVRRFKERLDDEYAEAVKVLFEHGLIRQQKKKGVLEWVRNTKAAKARMIQAMGSVENCKPTKGGDISCDREACEDSGDEVLETLAAYLSIDHQLSGDVPNLELGELHCRFDPFKTTDRTGCGSPYNLQNPPRKAGVRECFVPRPGFAFADADYDGLESRTGAQACLELVGQSEMADVLNAGRDLHIDMAAALLGIDYDACMARYKTHKKWEKTKGSEGRQDDEVSTARQFAKIANFGLSGGMGAETFFGHAQKELKKAASEKRSEGDLKAYQELRDLVTRLVWEGKEATDWGERPKRCTAETCIARGTKNVCITRVREVWRERWPEWPLYFARTAEIVKEGGDAAIAQGLFDGIFSGGLSYTDMNNFYFQNLGARCAKTAGWVVARACYDWTRNSPLYGSRIVNFVHDQFILEVPIAVAHEAAKELGRIMVEEANRFLPDVPAKTTPCLATCWSKEATDVYDCGRSDCKHEQCRLVPWSPKEATEEKKAA